MHKGFLLGCLEEGDQLDKLHTWEHNVKICLKGIGWEDVDWINGA
jgi:hypothetical protein